MNYFEVNFDGLVGLTHNYSGLSLDNMACVSNTGKVSRPKEAALQGLEKMKFLADMGLKQAFLPPPVRPHIGLLREAGFTGNDQDLLIQAEQEAPKLLQSSASAAAMWTANAATVSPSTDTKDQKLHITPANLIAEVHRSVEADYNYLLFSKLFSNKDLFTVHSPLMRAFHFSDEGAANHTRFGPSYADQGLHLFVYGRSSLDKNSQIPKFVPRQTLEASESIARHHGLNERHIIYAQQNPEAINAGVFHNDVISIGNLNLFLYHEEAFINTDEIINKLTSRYSTIYNEELYTFKVNSNKVSLEDAVNSYLFNSQIISIGNGEMALIAPTECERNPRVASVVHEIIESDFPINHVHFLDVKQSMMNGGGPACLRLRVVMSEEEIKALPKEVFIGEETYDFLKSWIEQHYWDELRPEDLSNIALLETSMKAHKELLQFLKINP